MRTFALRRNRWHASGFCVLRPGVLRGVSSRFSAGLRWFLRSRFGHLGGTFVVLVGHLKVVVFRHVFGVAEPLAHDVAGEDLAKFRLPCRSQIVKESRPWFDVGNVDDSHQLRPQIAVGIAIAGDDELRAFRCILKHFQQVAFELGEHRNDAGSLVAVVLRLGRVDENAFAIPVDVAPPQAQMLGRTAQPAVAA
nr:hypothetical protein [Humisphaera borealis]